MEDASGQAVAKQDHTEIAAHEGSQPPGHRVTPTRAGRNPPGGRRHPLGMSRLSPENPLTFSPLKLSTICGKSRDNDVLLVHT
jgi:hypothetical protein